MERTLLKGTKKKFKQYLIERGYKNERVNAIANTYTESNGQNYIGMVSILRKKTQRELLTTVYQFECRYSPYAPYERVGVTYD